jgi:hypothetical protein
MDCKSILGCVPLLGWGIGGHRIYKEYHRAKDQKTQGQAASVFSYMNKTEVIHGICEFVPLVGPLLYGSGKLICVAAQKACRLWEYIKQKRNGPIQPIVRSAPVIAQPVAPAAIKLGELRGLDREVLEQQLGKCIELRTTDVSIHKPYPLSTDDGRLKEIAEHIPQGKKESNTDYNRRIYKKVYRENAAKARSQVALSSEPAATHEITGVLLKVGKRNPTTGRYKVRIRYDITQYHSFRGVALENRPYGLEKKETLSFFVSDDELQRFNPPLNQ